MARTTSLLVLLTGAGLLAFAATQTSSAQTSGTAVFPGEPMVQRTARARTRIRVTPAYPYRLYSTTYPVPYKYEYPGPGAVRQCTSWLATEHRASGTVLTPQMRCWWER